MVFPRASSAKEKEKKKIGCSLFSVVDVEKVCLWELKHLLTLLTFLVGAQVRRAHLRSEYTYYLHKLKHERDEIN